MTSEKRKTNKRGFYLIITLVLIIGPVVFRFLRVTVPAVSANTVTIGISAYWDKDCTKEVSSINWGTMEPGVKNDKTIYLRNEEDSTITLSLATKNWSPVDASDYITLNWNYNGEIVSPRNVLQTILTLLVSPKIKGITSFNFDIFITTVTGGSGIFDQSISSGKEEIDHDWLGVTFPQGFGSTPVIVAVIMTENGGGNCHIDLKNPSASGFQVRVEEDASLDGAHAKETIGWIALDPGTYNINGATLVAGKNDANHNWAEVGFSGFSSTPTIVAQIMTENGGGNCHIDLRNPSASGFQVRVEEDASLDGTHARETIGWIAIN